MYTVKTLGCTCPPSAQTCSCVRHAIMLDGKELIAMGREHGLINQIVNAANMGLETIEKEVKALIKEQMEDE